MSIKFKDIVVVGFALFAMFFGAGNLIFPPFLGVISGSKWFISFIAFLFADGGLALLGVIAATGTQGDMMAFFISCSCSSWYSNKWSYTKDS